REEPTTFGGRVEELPLAQEGPGPGESLFLELGRLGPDLEHRFDEPGRCGRAVPGDPKAVVRLVQYDPGQRNDQVEVDQAGAELALALRLGTGEDGVLFRSDGHEAVVGERPLA